MKIAIIHGQNHKGSTYHIARALADSLATPEEISEFFLPKDMPHFCTGCAQCFMKSETLCPHYELLQPITTAFDEAELIILASPVYVMHTTGSMKALLDHYGYRFIVHRADERMFSKQAVCISTAAGGGMKSTNKDMKDSLAFWGVPKIYTYGTAVYAIRWQEVSEKKRAEITQKITKLKEKILANRGKTAASLKIRLFFPVVRMLQKKGMNPPDKAYWEEKGWLGKVRPWKR